MKWFWSILALVIGVAVVVALQPPRGARVDPKASAGDEAVVDQMLAAPTKPVPAPAAVAAPNAGPNAASSPGPAPAAAAQAKDAAAKEVAKDLLTPRADEASKPLANAAPKAAPKEEGDVLRDGLDVTINEAKVVPGSLRRRSDGSILADGKWVIQGDGTERNPYVVPWELLTSAMDTYQPRTGLKEIPQRIAFLDGKRVRVEGYLIFPLIVQQTAQCLVAFNQWDGCCIGVPPSAYDAIEVNLSSSIPVNRKHGLLFGGVEGILHVTPLLSDGWIYGLYAMDDARLKLEM